MSVNVKTAKRIGLFAAISVLISSVIGVGIFFKNGAVFTNNNDNPIGVIISWVLASIIALTTAFSFAEIGFNHRDGAGLAGASEKMLGKKFGRFISFNANFFYLGIINVCIAVFAAEAIVNVFVDGSQDSLPIHIGWILVIALCLLLVFLVLNYLSLKWSSRFQILSTFLKFIPLLMVGFAGLIYGIMNPEMSLFNDLTNSTDSGASKTISINSILASLPAILFAYDSFLGVATLQGEMDNPRKKVPLTIVLGMGICIAFYLFITIGQIMVSAGSAYGVFGKIFEDNPNAGKALRIVLSVFIMMCVLGTLNAFVLISLRGFAYTVQYRIVYGYWHLHKYGDNKLKVGLFIYLPVIMFWWIVLLIPSVIYNTDAFADGLSNFPTLFMFAVYGTIVLSGFINRFTKKVHVVKMPGFMIIAPIAVIGCYLAFGYQFFYFFSVNAFINPNSVVNWGLFAQGNFETKAYMASILFFVMLAVFVVVPLINDALLKQRYKKIDHQNILRKELLI